ncbi:MAG: effector binding domain-containing protein [Clostridiales bacterium]|jgi:DNA-binding transcriptional MerR regulator|nr:effector binding domain-containing protein [Clostridiales bacterium]
MELLTISEVSKNYGISTRMLRYYEQTGMIESRRRDDYAYRVYDETTITRLRQIIILRKLRIPVKQIAKILTNAGVAEAVEIFRKNMAELNEEITALSTVRDLLSRLIEDINQKTNVGLKLLSDEAIYSEIASLSFSTNKLKEDTSMDDLNRASEDLMKMQDKDVRIIYLPPMTVAAAYAEGEDTEGKANEMIKKFADEKGLLKIKPDARSFGFDCSPEEMELGVPSRVYEVWVSIPDDMEVPAPLVKRKFAGGLYAAHVLRAWDFADWRRLKEWITASEKYENDWGSPRWESKETQAGQGFEETLNFFNFIQNGKMENLQLDLLFPIREK